MKYKTLVVNKGTKFQEFYGHMVDYGWVTSQSPIHTMSEDITWEDIKREFPDNSFDGIDLVTIEINIIEE